MAAKGRERILRLDAAAAHVHPQPIAGSEALGIELLAQLAGIVAHRIGLEQCEPLDIQQVQLSTKRHTVHAADLAAKG